MKVRYPGERSRGRGVSRGMSEFSGFIEGLDLREQTLNGVYFTWSNMKVSQSMSKLDRFLLSEEWNEKFPCWKGESLPRITSDHVAILLNGKGTLDRLSLKICGRYSQVLGSSCVVGGPNL